jgi:hypothetical protein
MKALLNIAGKVQILGKEVMEEDIAEARKYGADDRTLHDTVLIAATFCMFQSVCGWVGIIDTDRSCCV